MCVFVSLIYVPQHLKLPSIFPSFFMYFLICASITEPSANPKAGSVLLPFFSTTSSIAIKLQHVPSSRVHVWMSHRATGSAPLFKCLLSHLVVGLGLSWHGAAVSGDHGGCHADAHGAVRSDCLSAASPSRGPCCPAPGAGKVRLCLCYGF